MLHTKFRGNRSVGSGGENEFSFDSTFLLILIENSS